MATKKESASSRRERLVSVNSSDIFCKPLTKQQRTRAALRCNRARCAAGTGGLHGNAIATVEQRAVKRSRIGAVEECFRSCCEWWRAVGRRDESGRFAKRG